MELDLQLDKLSKEVKKHKARNIFIQLPEGLKTKIPIIQKELSNYNTFFSLDSVFGACDLQEHNSKAVKSSLTIHFGHSEFYKSKNVIYWPCYYTANKKEINNYIKQIKSNFKNQKITIIYPIQYINIVMEIKKELKSNNKVNIIEGKTNNRIKNKGQVLGCDVSTALPILSKIDSIVYIGDGSFHSTAFINFPNTKPVYEVTQNTVKEIKIPKTEVKRRELLKHIIWDKKIFAIYISSKKGQNDYKSALKIKKKLEKEGKTVYMFVADNISNEKLIGLDIDVLVNTACPRIIDDFKSYKTIVVNKDFIM